MNAIEFTEYKIIDGLFTPLDDDGNAIYSTDKSYINMKNVTKIN